jgi:hypothetical protein
MDEPAAASRRGICNPCLHYVRGSPLGPCTAMTGVGACDLAADLGGEEDDES